MRGSMSDINIMIAENDPGLQQALCDALSDRAGINVISTVSTRETAIKQLLLNPDIILLDPQILKDQALPRFLSSIQTRSPRTRTILLLKNMVSDEDLLSDLRAGVRGYVRTIDPPAIMLKAIHAVFEGELWVERRILEKAVSKPLSIMPETTQLAPLTTRERDMLTQVIQGSSNREIADRSSISERTVKTHLYRVYRKLNVKSRTKAIALFSHS